MGFVKWGVVRVSLIVCVFYGLFRVGEFGSGVLGLT